MLNQKDLQRYRELKKLEKQACEDPVKMRKLGFSKRKLRYVEQKLRIYLGTITDEIQRDAMRNYIFRNMQPEAAAWAAVHDKTLGKSSRSVKRFVLTEIGKSQKA